MNRSKLLNHPWDVSPKEAVKLQRKLAGLIRTEWNPKREIITVAGVDVSVKNNVSRSAVVLLDFKTLTPFEQKTSRKKTPFPYVSGLLSFREIPVILHAFEKLLKKPDLVIVDGQGIAHQRRIGIAAHLGLLIKIPTIGCAKSRLCGKHRVPADKKGSKTTLYHNKEKIGCVLRTRENMKPVYVSPGHLIDTVSAVKFIKKCTRGFRLPEPIRMAHQAAGGADVVEKFRAEK